MRRLPPKRENFRRLAAKRTLKTLDEIRKIGNLASSNYEYDHAEVEKIFSSLEVALQQTRGLFRKSTPPAPFQL